MREELTGRPMSPAAGVVASVGGGPPDATIALPRLALPGAGVRVWRSPVMALRPAYGLAALAALLAGCMVVVVFAAAGPSALVPRSFYAFPGWVAGPVSGVFGSLHISPAALGFGLTTVLAAMAVAYGVVLACARMLSARTIVVAIVALHAVMLLSPPLQLTDLYNYLGYARLGALHQLNPYTHVLADIQHDPVFGLSTWHNWTSPYGPAFTLLTYPLAYLPLPVAYWILKLATMLASLGFLALVWRCARQLGHDPRLAVLFVAANPIFLIYELGGFHNDVFMLVPAMGAISLLLAGRERWSGAMLMVAVAVKFTMVLLLPFLVFAARAGRPRTRVLEGAAAATLPLAAASIAAFGFAIPNVSNQSTIVTPFSGPNIVGLVLGFGGGAPTLLRVANLLAVLAVAGLVGAVALRRLDWLTGAGAATLALLASLAWLMPWYVVWVLPLAAIGSSLRLRRTAAAVTVFLLVSFAPATGIVLGKLHVNPMGTAVGRAADARLMRLIH
jgi:hypothetical protein